ncbi:MAG: heme o synthase [Rickettsiales bacterium]|nr:heme o synthase [Rickettsiales bacterium]
MSTATLVESTAKDWLTLTKPGVMLLVLFSGATGMWLAPGTLNPVLQIAVIVAIGMGSASGAIFNMVYDRDIDSIMKRTQKRPIVTGAIAASDAGLQGLLLSIAGVAVMGLAANWMAAGLLAFSIFFYSVVYTIWLKRHTAQNIVIGGAAGAFPPVIGWMAVTGEAMTALPWLLFLTIFLWTPPHFWALALYRNEDYKTAKVPMLPVTAGKEATKKQMVFYTIILVATTLAIPFSTDTLGVVSLAAAVGLGGMFFIHSLRVLKADDDKIAMKMFGYSIIYLFALFAVLLLDYWIIPR